MLLMVTWYHAIYNLFRRQHLLYCAQYCAQIQIMLRLILYTPLLSDFQLFWCLVIVLKLYKRLVHLIVRVSICWFFIGL